MKDDLKRFSALQKDQSWNSFLGLLFLRLVTCFRLLMDAIVKELGWGKKSMGSYCQVDINQKKKKKSLWIDNLGNWEIGHIGNSLIFFLNSCFYLFI